MMDATQRITFTMGEAEQDPVIKEEADKPKEEEADKPKEEEVPLPGGDDDNNDDEDEYDFSDISYGANDTPIA